MPNPRMQNANHLKNVAYSNADKLNARIRFWQLYGEAREQVFGRFFDTVHGATNLPDRLRVLDVGCGPAHIWQWGIEHDLVPLSWELTLTDLSEGMVTEARTNLSRFDHSVTLQTVDVCDLPFENESFDLVVANYMLYHARSQDLALKEISRVLVPGGRLFAGTNSDKHISEFLDLQRKFIADPSDRKNIGLAHEAFTLENAADHAKPYFSEVEIQQSRSICEATDPQVVIDYAHSMDAQLDQDALEKHVISEIRENGYFRVTRHSGTVIATR